MKVSFYLSEDAVKRIWKESGEKKDSAQNIPFNPDLFTKDERAAIFPLITGQDVYLKHKNIVQKDWDGSIFPAKKSFLASTVDPYQVIREYLEHKRNEEEYLERQQVQYAESLEITAKNVVEVRKMLEGFCGMAQRKAKNAVNKAHQELLLNTFNLKQGLDYKKHISIRGVHGGKPYDFEAAGQREWWESYLDIVNKRQEAHQAAKRAEADFQAEEVKDWAWANGSDHTKALIEGGYEWLDQAMEEMLLAAVPGSKPDEDFSTETLWKPSLNIISTFKAIDALPKFASKRLCLVQGEECIEIGGTLKGQSAYVYLIV